MRHLCWPIAVALAMSGPVVPLPAQEADFFISPQGKDAWSGTRAAPNPDQTDGPFATVSRAQEAVRQRKAHAKPDRPLVVLLRGGRYELQKPIAFTSEDSGTVQVPIVYTAYPGESPLLGGGRQIKHWKQAQCGLWMAEVPEIKNGTWTFRQMFVNGRPCTRPRLPREGFYRVTGFAGINPKKYNTPSNKFEFHAGDLHADWKNLCDVECVVLHFWVDAHFKIGSVDERTKVVMLDRFSRRRFSDDYQGKGARYYVESVFEALDRPGQFYVDRPAGAVYYFPRPEEDMRTATVIAPRLDSLVIMQGDPARQRFVEHIHLRGLTFTENTWEMPAAEAGDGQAACTVPGAILLSGARHCAVENCMLKNLGSYAVELWQGCQANRIVANEIGPCGAGGIKLNGGAAGSATERRTSNNTITDNHIHHCGEIYHSGVGILSMHSGGNVIAHNHIHHLYYTGISVGWVWGYGPSVSSGNRIEHNDIHDIGQGLLSDMGGVYLLGLAPGTVVRSNRIHDVDSWSYGGWGIYTDEGSTGVRIENNVVYRTKSGGFHQHYGKDNLIRNNIFALSRNEQLARTRREPHRSFTFERNIVYFREGTLLGKNWSGPGFEMDYNDYFQFAGRPIRFPTGDFASWRQNGHDRHSIIADPQFVAPQRDDFSLRPTSPALKLGFVPIDLSQIGPRKQK